uniref:CCD97-like C-terminal domain-containing protein n=1 Tax=Arion vulgaris TaxID=1028688 RepID=A0A0B7AIJ4_9EUPU
MAEDGLQTLSNRDMENLRNKMINKLIKTDAHFKHQQRGEPDLTEEEKSSIALDILNKSPTLFLERFSTYLSFEDTRYFNDQKGDYLVDFYIEEISKRSTNCNQKVVKNRRFRAMQKLMDEGEYFSENEMKWREPLLYEQMVGQYTSESEKMEQMEQDIDRSDLRLSSILLKHMDIQTNKQFCEMQKEKEEQQEEESESEEDDSDEEDKSQKNAQVDSQIKTKNREDADCDADSDDSDAERKYFRSEFLRTMQEKFLSGEDASFDYRFVYSVF